MQSIEMVAVLAVFQFLCFGLLTGLARKTAGLEVPAVSGHEGFERMYRVQMNTLELLIAFLPALFLAGKYWPTTLVSGLGLVYLIGRMIYWRAYVSNPEKRGLGFMISWFPTLFLVILSFIGVLLAWIK